MNMSFAQPEYAHHKSVWFVSALMVDAILLNDNLISSSCCLSTPAIFNHLPYSAAFPWECLLFSVGSRCNLITQGASLKANYIKITQAANSQQMRLESFCKKKIIIKRKKTKEGCCQILGGRGRRGIEGEKEENAILQ